MKLPWLSIWRFLGSTKNNERFCWQLIFDTAIFHTAREILYYICNKRQFYLDQAYCIISEITWLSCSVYNGEFLRMIRRRVASELLTYTHRFFRGSFFFKFAQDFVEVLNLHETLLELVIKFSTYCKLPLRILFSILYNYLNSRRQMVSRESRIKNSYDVQSV